MADLLDEEKVEVDIPKSNIEVTGIIKSKRLKVELSAFSSVVIQYSFEINYKTIPSD